MDTIKDSQNLIDLIKSLKRKGIFENEYKKYVDSFLENKARTQAIPLTGNFELTPFCNLDCKMCYVHLSDLQYNKKNLLSISEWKMLIRQAYESGMRNASLTGGECLTYPGFDDVYLSLYGYGITPSILSNGVLLDDERVAFLKAYPPRMIQVTLYGSSEDAYETVTGHRVFHKVYRNLYRIQEAGLPFKISVTPNSFMRDDIYPLFELLDNLHMPYYINANLIPPRKNTGRVTHDLSIDEYVEIFKLNSKKKNHELHSVDFSEIMDESHKCTERRGLLCGAGRSSFGIRFDGKMCPCLSLGDDVVDIAEMGFFEAWKKINTLANNYPLPLECGDCVYSDRCLPCIAMHQNAEKKGHCDSRICERTKKLIGAGFIPLPEMKKD